jgi:hypothetical protein
MLMFWFVLVCGWGLTAALIALVWINTRRGRSLLAGLGIGALGGLLWPVTAWVAVGAWFYARAARRSGQTPVDPAALAGQVQQAQAYAQQAEIEGMSASAEYWRAEVRRLTAQQHAPTTLIAHPAATGLIVVGCTIASLATIGALWFAAPSPEPAPAAAGPPSSPAGPAVPAPVGQTAGRPVTPAPTPAPIAEIGQTVSNRGVTLTVKAAHAADFIEMNESGFRPGSGYEKYTRTAPDPGGKFIVVETHVVNNANVSMDLTCSLPISTVLVDAQDRNFDPIHDLYKLKGNPECNDQLQPGFEADMTYVYLVPTNAVITEWGFKDTTELLGSSEYTAVHLSV